MYGTGVFSQHASVWDQNNAGFTADWFSGSVESKPTIPKLFKDCNVGSLLQFCGLSEQAEPRLELFQSFILLGILRVLKRPSPLTS